MKTIAIRAGLDIPISGEPIQEPGESPPISHIALIGDDYPGMKPTMAVNVGDRVKTGQLLFSDKKNEGVLYTSPGCGEVVAINRGAKRKFESVVIRLEGTDFENIFDPDDASNQNDPEKIRDILIRSGLWPGFRTRPYGKVPAIDTNPASLFITATETTPLAPSPAAVISLQSEEWLAGLDVLEQLFEIPIHLCISGDDAITVPAETTINTHRFSGPHPAGLPSTHIHMIDPVSENHVVWHISYQDVIGIGHLFQTGSLLTEKIIALSGPTVKEPQLYKVPIGADILELCEGKLAEGNNRILSGSVLDGRVAQSTYRYLGRYHQQVSALADDSGRSFFNWALPGSDRFSITPVFSSYLDKARKFAMPTATWGGDRAIFPLGTYEQVMPLDILATPLLRSIAVGDTEKARQLGALELIEEDLSLCSFVCPGKNDFGPMLREVLTTLEEEG